MPEPHSPEPMRAMFDSDESHAAAWLQWATGTPGGWSARLSEKAARGDLVPAEWRFDTAGVDPPRGGTELVRYVQAPSPCCQAAVLVDPLVPTGSRGLCSVCGAVLDYADPSWGRRTPGA